MVDCPTCHEQNPARARFCLHCGTQLQAGPSPEARKTVTVLFTDVVGSTQLGERLDPESLSQVMARWFAHARTVISSHGGTVQKYVGDAVMAVFGLPVLHEDDALRAVRAAADLRDGLAVVNQELADGWGVTLDTRTGVGTGEVVIDPAVGDALVLGDVANVAARFEQAAEPGQILLGQVTWRLVRDAVEAEPVPALTLKGKRRPVRCWRLLAAADGEPGRPGLVRRALAGGRPAGGPGRGA
jgi:class 3 adenylate cyclase